MRGVADDKASYDMHMRIMCARTTNAQWRDRSLARARHIKRFYMLLTNSCKSNLRENV